MIFISMFLALIFLIVLLAGLLNLITSITLIIVWIVLSGKKKKVPVVLKVFAIICGIIGAILFILPLTVGIVTNVKKQADFNKIENKIYADKNPEWSRKGFNYNGKYLERLDFGGDIDIDKAKKVGAIVTYEESASYIDIYLLESDSGYDIYSVQGDLYADAKDVSAINNYYHNEADMESYISFYDSEKGSSTKYECNFDKDILFDIEKYYDTKSDDISLSTEDVDYSYRICIISADRLFYKDISLSESDGIIFLEHTSGGGNVSGIKIEEKYSDYIKKQVSEFTDIYK